MDIVRESNEDTGMGKKGKSKHKGHGPELVADETAATAPAPAHETSATTPLDAAQVATRLNGAAIHLLRRLHREDAAQGTSSTRLSALSVLVLGGPRTLGQLAGSEGVTPPSMTRLVTAMEVDGFVTRSRSEKDGRLVIISATPAGADLLHRGRDQRVEALAALVRSLPDTEQRTLESAAGILEELLRPARRS